MNAAAQRVRSGVVHGEPLAPHTSWRTGGPADTFFEPRTLEELASFLASLPADEPVHFIGRGSNLLVRDGGIRGAVVSTRSLAREFRVLGEGRVAAGAGLPCATLARRCVRARLGPAAFFAGIPGTVGGALAMNAGAFGGETWDSVEQVTTIDRAGVVRTRARSEYEIGYRTVKGPAGEWFVGAELRFRAEASEDAAALKAMMSRRGATQPLDFPSAGSVFRNPPGRHAGELIERAGLKGRQVGAAKVSDKHANFIVNTGNATAAEIEQLIDEVRAEVERRFGVVLEPEVRIVGEAAEGRR